MRKLKDKEFLQIVNKFDILCLNECWVKCPDEFDLLGYEKEYIVRKKCNGGGVIVFYKKWLNPFITFVKSCVDCMIWFKVDKSILCDNTDLYICSIYMPPYKNVYYRKYDIDVFDNLQEHIEMFSNIGNVAVIGDLNGRVGQEPDNITGDVIDKQLQDNISFINYVNDDVFLNRQSEDIKPRNNFGQRILQLCKNSGLRICNGRFGKESQKITFNNKNGCSVIDYMLISQNIMFNILIVFLWDRLIISLVMHH